MSSSSTSSVSYELQSKRISAALVLNGLSEKEASIYLNLLVNGEAKAGDLAKALKLHRLDVYNALKNLQSKEIVAGTMTKPMVFRASPLPKVIEIVRRDQSEALRQRASAMNELSNSGKLFYEFLRRSNTSEDSQRRTSDRIQIITGRKSISEKWKSYLSTATNEFLVATTERGTMQSLLLQSLDALKLRVRKDKLVVKIFTPIRARDYKTFEKSGLLIRDLTAQNSAGMCIVDKDEVLMVTEQMVENAPRIAEENAVVIRSTSIVGMIRTMFFVGWDTSPTLIEAGKQL